MGLGGILEPVHQTSSTGARYYACHYELCEEMVVSTEGMRSHIKQVHALYSYSFAYCPFMTKNFASLKSHEKGCKGAYDLDLFPSINKDYSRNKGKVGFFLLFIFFWRVSVCVNADRTGQLAPLFF